MKLYNFTDSAFASKVIGGITDVKSAPYFARVVSENGIAFARGTRVEIDLDDGVRRKTTHVTTAQIT